MHFEKSGTGWVTVCSTTTHYRKTLPNEIRWFELTDRGTFRRTGDKEHYLESTFQEWLERQQI